MITIVNNCFTVPHLPFDFPIELSLDIGSTIACGTLTVPNNQVDDGTQMTALRLVESDNPSVTFGSDAPLTLFDDDGECGVCVCEDDTLMSVWGCE